MVVVDRGRRGDKLGRRWSGGEKELFVVFCYGESIGKTAWYVACVVVWGSVVGELIRPCCAKLFVRVRASCG